MPNFTNAPPDEGRGPALRLIRTPAPGKLIATVTCKRLVGCPTHFYQRRTIPCDNPGCPACESGHSWRWHGYVSAVNHQTHEHFIFEMTAQAAEPFTRYHERHDTLHGCIFIATRLGGHHNGRVLIQCKPQDLTGVQLPPPPDMIKSLCHIWNIPTPQVKVDGILKGNDRLRVMSPLERRIEDNAGFPKPGEGGT